MTSDSSNRANMVVRLAVMSLPLALLLYNVGACLHSGLTGAPLRVWAGDEGGTVAIPGVPLEAERVAPGSRTWWMILGTYGLPLLVLSVVVARRVRAKRQAREAELYEQDPDEEPPEITPSADSVDVDRITARKTPPASRRTGTKRIHLLDPKIVGRMGKVCLIAWGCIGALVLVSWLRGRGLNDLLTQPSGSRGSGFIYAGIYAIGFVAVWLGFRWALRTVVVFTPTGLVLERNGRPAWRVSWEGVREWRRELGSNGQLRAVVFHRHGGSPRRIEMGWLGLGSESYGELLSEVRARTGMDESPPVKVKGSRTGPIIAFGTIGAVIILALIIFLFDDIYEKIIYWGIR